MEPTDRSKYDPRIDVLRAFACGMVAIVHTSVPTWTNPIADHHLIIDTVALGIIHTGWLGVPLFLFLSGFSLALNKTHSNYELDKKQFFINRVLRIYPIWFTCILILSFTHKLTGINVFTLLLMQTQDIPTATAFGIAWSLKLEFMCYLLYPVMLAAVATRKNILPFFAFFFLIRVWMYMVPTQWAWELAYSTVFGGGTIFLAGMFTASLPPLRDKKLARIHLSAGIILFCAVAVFIHKMGGYQTAQGKLIHVFYMIMPEVIAGTVFLIVRGTVTRISNVGGSFGAAAVPSLHRAMKSVGSAVFNALAHFGRVSYSAYIFSLFTLDFTSRVFSFIKPHGWLSMIVMWVLYFAALTTFATVSFYAIEMPFLALRRRYVHSAPETASLGTAKQKSTVD